MSNLSLTSSDMREFIRNALELKMVPYIFGPPGIGKSQICAQVAEEAGCILLDIRLAQTSPEDFLGLPKITDGRSSYVPFGTFPLEGDSIPDGYSGWIVLLDELPSAPPEVLVAAYSLILDRKVGGHKLHPAVYLVAAGNSSTDSAIADPLPDTILTRVLPVELAVSFDDWYRWAESEGLNKNLLTMLNARRGVFRPEDTEREENDPLPTPRTWTNVSRILDAHDKQPAGDPISEPHKNMIRACVGTYAAEAVFEYISRLLHLPTVYEILSRPSTTQVPSSVAGRSMVIEQIANEFPKHITSLDAERFWDYMSRFPAESRVELHSRITQAGADPHRTVEQCRGDGPSKAKPTKLRPLGSVF